MEKPDEITSKGKGLGGLFKKIIIRVSTEGI